MVEILKRRPFLFGLAAVVLLVGLAAVQLARPSKAENPRLEKFLPSDAVGFVEVNDLRAQALKIIESEAWREFSKENSAASSLFMIGANHAGVLDASYAVALLGVASNEDGKPEPQFVVVAQFDGWESRRTFERRVLSFVKEEQKKGVETKTEEYGGAKLNVVTKEGKHGFAYAYANELLVVSNTADAVKRVLDVRAGKAQSLETNQTFARARAASPGVDGMFGFLDGAALTRIIDNAPAGEDANKKVAAFKQLFHGVGASSVQSVAFTSTFEDGRVAERFTVVAPNREGVLATVASNPPTEQKLLALVPEGATAAFDASIANAPQTFEQMFALLSEVSAQSGSGKGLEDALSEFTEKTGVDFRGEILGALGSEVCVAQLSTGEGHEGVVLLDVRDEQAFTRALAKFAESKKREVTEREYKGVALRRVAGEEGKGLEYAFVGSTFVASSNGSAVERVVETAQGGRSLRSSAAYAQALAQAQGQPQFVYYNSNADYLNRLGRALKSGEQEFKTEGQRAAIRPSFAFGVTRADGFYVESRTPLGTFPRLLAAVSSRLGDGKQEHHGGE
ncbi:MAG TPA: DUF3352 domain-containing protein [Pyrinomonadaceae bacterium]|jgi:hypothetical protein|nr:DUF3352 domain-containing protein [Pyrinomonadaceae bacterium]